jgi:hypothetical protein
MKALLAASPLLIFFACSAPPPQADPESPVAADRLLALREQEWTTSSHDLALLIEQLDSSDPAVRMLAADILLHLTGEDHGFRYDDPAPARSAAVDQWAEWLRQRVDSDRGAGGASGGDGEPPIDA